MRGGLFLVAAACAVLAAAPSPAPASPLSAMTEFSAQARPQSGQPARRTQRITVRPAAPRDVRGMRRECAAEFEERFIPQWGGYVLYANRRCWWVPG